METEQNQKKKVKMISSKCGAIFIILGLFGLFLLQRISFDPKLFPRPRLKPLYPKARAPATTSLPLPPPLKNKQTDCYYWRQEMSREDLEEERTLVESVAWPEPPYSSLPPLKMTSNPRRSWFTILPAEGGRERRVGDQLEVLVKMFDSQDHPKLYGGDVLYARVHNRKLVAAVAGQVVDHLNGSYSVFFPLLWEGDAEVEVMLVHPSEAVPILKRLRRENPHRLRFQSNFRSGSVTETTYCNVCLPPTKHPICNYTDPYTKDPWYCYKPKKLGCDARVSHQMSRSQKMVATKDEIVFFQKGLNLKVYIPPSGNATVNVLPESQDKPQMKSNIGDPVPTGYYYQGVWRNLGGVEVRTFHNASAITQCLKGKTLYIYGDSTARQWFEYLNGFLPELKELKLHGRKFAMPPYMAVDTKENILVYYRCHSVPLVTFGITPARDLAYASNELDKLNGGNNTVVAISVWAHLPYLPIEVFIKRMRDIRNSIIRLQERAPGTTVVIRTGNPRSLVGEGLPYSLNFSDWCSMIRTKIIWAMFKGQNVHFVDAWQMTQIHYRPHNIHPERPVIRNMINVLMSHIC